MGQLELLGVTVLVVVSQLALVRVLVAVRGPVVPVLVLVHRVLLDMRLLGRGLFRREWASRCSELVPSLATLR